MDDLYLEMQDKKRQLYSAINRLRELGTLKSSAKKNYHVRYTQMWLVERAKGRAIGELENTLKGFEEIAELLQIRENLEAEYDVCQEMINALKIDVKTIENQLNREFGYEGKQL